MTHRLATVKAAVIAAVFAAPLGAMVFVPLWFVLAFLSRLITGQIHPATFVLAGLAAAAFMVWVFRLVFGYFRGDTCVLRSALSFCSCAFRETATRTKNGTSHLKLSPRTKDLQQMSAREDALQMAIGYHR